MSIEALYQRRVDAFSAAERRYAFRERIAMHLRVATFALAVASFVVGWKGQQELWYVAGGAMVGAFAAAVGYHEHVRRQMLRNRVLRQINQQAIARLHRHWQGVPQTPVEVPPQYRAIADDLDLFGPASLFHLLCTAGTPQGIRLLRQWLLVPAAPEEIQRRQQAVRELAPQLDFRHTLMLEARLLADAVGLPNALWRGPKANRGWPHVPG